MNLRARKKEEQKQKIIDCSIALFKEKGFNNTSIEEILEKVDISKGTLYNYFPEKAAIVSAYIHDLFMSYTYNEDETTEEKIRRLFGYTVSILDENPELTKAYFIYRKSEEFSLESENASGIRVIAEKIISDGQENGEISNDFDRNFLIISLGTCIISAIMPYVFSNEKFDANKMANQSVALFLRGAIIKEG